MKPKLTINFLATCTAETNKIKLTGEFSLHSLESTDVKFLSGSTCIINLVRNMSVLRPVSTSILTLWVIRENAFHVSPIFSSLHSSRHLGFCS